MGAAAATGEWLAFLDDDAYPAPGWLEAAVPHFDNPRVWAVGGPGVTPPNDDFRAQASGWTYASWIVSGPARFRYVPGRSRAVDDHPSMNLMLRRSAFQAVGGFDSAFYPGEDTKLCLELVHRGGMIRYEPGALVYHHRRPVMHGHLRQIAHYGRHRGYFAPGVSGNLSAIPVLHSEPVAALAGGGRLGVGLDRAGSRRVPWKPGPLRCCRGGQRADRHARIGQRWNRGHGRADDCRQPPVLRLAILGRPGSSAAVGAARPRQVGGALVRRRAYLRFEPGSSEANRRRRPAIISVSTNIVATVVGRMVLG